MEVTKQNFEEVLCQLPGIFKAAQFLTFDTEFTGLRVEGATNNNYFDTLEDLYLKDKLRAETFMAIQFGIVAFFYHEETKRYTHEAYNFYIFPSSFSDINFTCQNRSISFLTEHGFDFNKLFREGIPYLKKEEVDKLVEKLEEKFEKNNYIFESGNKLEIPVEHTVVIDPIIKKIENILESKSKVSFKTEKFFSFLRKSIYKTVQSKFGSEVLLETNKDETMTVLVGYNNEEIKEIQKKKFLKAKKEILDEEGFSKVVQLLIESKKLIIGHNLFLDLLFTIKQFIYPLPNSYSEFKELVHFLFPKIIDTKYMAASSDFKNIKDTSLYNLIEHLENINAIPEVNMTENGKGYTLEGKKLHEAAYDAYLTGVIFLAMTHQLGNLQLISNVFFKLDESKFLDPYLNKLSIRKLCDIPFMNIGCVDIIPDRNGVYYLTFPQEWKRDNICELFKNCGYVNISWINSTSAFVRVNNEYIAEVEKNLLGSHKNYKILTYQEYNNIKQHNSDIILSPLMEKRLGNNSKNVTNNGSSPFKSFFNPGSKRQMEEDIGEVIERPAKKQLCN